MTFDPIWYNTISDDLWMNIYDHLIDSMWLMKNHGSGSEISRYFIKRDQEALRDMEAQAILSELRRVNCRKNSNTSTALAATR